jgi:hypothetical protein
VEPVEYLGVGGTHASRREDEWNHLGSKFTRFALRRGLRSVEERARVPFFWSTDLDFGKGEHEDWKALGFALYYYHVPALAPIADGGSALALAGGIPGGSTRLICHSHAGNGAFYAAALGLKIECLVTVGTPVVGGMDDVIRKARPNIARWLHLYSPRDWTQLAGELLDGRWGWRRKFDKPGMAADVNDEMPRGHGNVLRDEDLFSLWVDRGWFRFIKGE